MCKYVAACYFLLKRWLYRRYIYIYECRILKLYKFVWVNKRSRPYYTATHNSTSTLSMMIHLLYTFILSSWYGPYRWHRLVCTTTTTIIESGKSHFWNICGKGSFCRFTYNNILCNFSICSLVTLPCHGISFRRYGIRIWHLPEKRMFSLRLYRGSHRLP